MNLLATRTLGRYQILEQIGKGGMAAVFRAFDPQANAYVALKVLPPVMAQERQFSERFRREAEVVMRLKHSHIVPVLGFGEQDGCAYLVMPLLQVGSLADRLQTGPLTPSEGARLVQQVSAALQFAHDRGIVHRDVKPSNILLDTDGNALLSDFGLARIHDASISLTGSALLGTPAYMSPEQARGDPADARSDQYALGVILYQLSTGSLPFDAETPMAVLMKQINEPVPQLRLRSPKVPEVVEQVILKATAKDPQHRFDSVATMNQAFQAALAHARDPARHAAPTIELPPITSTLHPSQAAAKASAKKRRRRLATFLALLLLLACPAGFLVLRGLAGPLTGPAGGGSTVPASVLDAQLTELAGTIEAMSTKLAAAQDGSLPAHQIPTLAYETLVAGGDIAQGSLSPTTTDIFELPTVAGSETPAATGTFGPSSTPSTAPTRTQTSTAGPSPTPTRTPTHTHTATSGPSPTASKTATPAPSPSLPPTSTSSPTAAPSSTATSSITPSPTLAATTPVALSPTSPPSSPTTDICQGLELGPFAFAGQEVRLTLINNRPSNVTIVAIDFDWPEENEKLKKIELAGSTIWDQEDQDPPTHISAGWKGNRNIPPGSSKSMTFFFDQNAQPGGYSLDIQFNNGCGLHAP